MAPEPLDTLDNDRGVRSAVQQDLDVLPVIAETTPPRMHPVSGLKRPRPPNRFVERPNRFAVREPTPDDVSVGMNVLHDLQSVGFQVVQPFPA